MSVNNYAQEKFYAWDVNADIDDLPFPVQSSEISYVPYMSMVGNFLLKENDHPVCRTFQLGSVYIKYCLLSIVPYSPNYS